jgi:hypothetical protein
LSNGLIRSCDIGGCGLYGSCVDAIVVAGAFEAGGCALIVEVYVGFLSKEETLALVALVDDDGTDDLLVLPELTLPLQILSEAATLEIVDVVEGDG